MKRNAALCFLNSVTTANVYQICSAPTEYETALTVQEEEEHLRLHLCDPVCGGVERKVNLFFFFLLIVFSIFLSSLFSVLCHGVYQQRVCACFVEVPREKRFAQCGLLLAKRKEERKKKKDEREPKKTSSVL